MRTLRASTAVALVTVAAAAASPPTVGVLVPGQSLGGIRLGWTKTQVTTAWGGSYGRCRSCTLETLYFNRVAFRPRGAGIELRQGRVVRVFTLWAPPGWRTSRGLRIGDPELVVNGIHRSPPRTMCDGYDALVLPDRPGRSVIYVADGEVWGFGLVAGGLPVCL